MSKMGVYIYFHGIASKAKEYPIGGFTRFALAKHRKNS